MQAASESSCVDEGEGCAHVDCCAIGACASPRDQGQARRVEVDVDLSKPCPRSGLGQAARARRTGAPPAPTTMDVQVTSKQRRSLAPPVAGAENPTAQQQQSGAYNGGGGAEPAAPLPPLESFREIELKRAQYVGPTDESNWVIPGRARGVRNRRFREKK